MPGIRRRSLPLALIALLLTLAACTREKKSDFPTAVHATPAPDSEPPTKPGTLRIEGEEAAVTLRKIDRPGVPFTTFVPEGDFDVESGRDDRGAFARFTVQFGGTRNPDAYILFGFPESTADAVRDELLGEGGRFDREGWRAEIGPPPCLWAEEGVVYVDQERGASGILCIGTHAGRPFYVLTHHPDEYGDGFDPRLDVALAEFRWRDTGAALRGE